MTAAPGLTVVVAPPGWDGPTGPESPDGPVAAVGLAVLAGEHGPEPVPPVTGPLAGVPLPAALDAGWCARAGFSAERGQTLVLRDPARVPAVVLVGLGRPGPGDRHGPADVDGPVDRWRRAAAALVRAAGAGGTALLVVPQALLGGDPEAVGAAVAEGSVLAAYRFEAYRSAPRPGSVDRLVLLLDDPADGPGSGGAAPRAAFEAGVVRGLAAARAVGWARDLVNTPASDLTPEVLADRARTDLGALPGVTVEIWDEDRIAAERMGGLLGVARGSTQPPRFVRAERPAATRSRSRRRPRHVVLVGKGITFDSGGLSLKSADGMTTMKTDMSGAAVVLGALQACQAAGVRARVTALAPITENMPGGSAVKPGDVLRTRNGTTIEVLNTDAEGRLVLADALSLAAELAPDAIVDVATLTGAAGVALGAGVAPVFGTDQSLVAALVDAGHRAGERLWPMPMPADYRELIDSDVADIKNIGRGGQAGAIVAAMVLARFVGEVPWAHLDIAGTGRSTEAAGILSKGGTAFGLRTLVELLRTFGA